jgi:hypothetical protein
MEKGEAAQAKLLAFRGIVMLGAVTQHLESVLAGRHGGVGL